MRLQLQQKHQQRLQLQRQQAQSQTTKAEITSTTKQTTTKPTTTKLKPTTEKATTRKATTTAIERTTQKQTTTKKVTQPLRIARVKMIIGCLVVMSVNGIAARKISKLNIWLNLTNGMQSLITKKLIGIPIYIVLQVAMNCGAVLTVASGQEIINTDNKTE